MIRSERIKLRGFTESPLVNRTSNRHLFYGQDRAISEKILIIFLIIVSLAPTILISLWEPLFAPIAVICFLISILIIRARIKTSLKLEGG
ncbi:MAG: hypothetical protein ACFE95_01080 [Candidatus Hodarchaeota archaeon]